MSYSSLKCSFLPLSRKDFKHSLAWHNDAAIRNAVFGYRFPITQEMEEQWYDSVLKDSSQARFAIRVNDDEETIGFVMLTSIDYISRNAEVGILIGNPAYRGKGIAQDAIAFIEDFARKTLNLNKVFAKIASFNSDSLHLFETLDYTEEGVLRKHYFVEGQYYDVHILSKLF